MATSDSRALIVFKFRVYVLVNCSFPLVKGTTKVVVVCIWTELAFFVSPFRPCLSSSHHEHACCC